MTRLAVTAQKHERKLTEFISSFNFCNLFICPSTQDLNKTPFVGSSTLNKNHTIVKNRNRKRQVWSHHTPTNHAKKVQKKTHSYVQLSSYRAECTIERYDLFHFSTDFTIENQIAVMEFKMTSKKLSTVRYQLTIHARN